MEGGKKKPKRESMLQCSTVCFCFVVVDFFFSKEYVCSTIAQMMLLEEYKLLVFIAYSCFTALLE